MAEELAEGEADDIAEAYLKAKFQKTKLWGIINVVRFCISETATMVGGSHGSSRHEKTRAHDPDVR